MVIKNAKPREKVSTSNEEKYQAKLVRVRAAIRNKTLTKFTVVEAKKFNLHNDGFKRAKRELEEEGLLEQRGRSYFAVTATEVSTA